MSAYIRIALAFASFTDSNLAAFTKQIIESLTGNVSFPNLPYSVVELTTGLTNFSTAMAAAAQGGTPLTAAKNAAREELLNLLRAEANYVQGVASQDLPMLLSSGFTNIDTNRAQSPLLKPDIAALENENAAEMVLRLQPMANAKAFEVQVRTGTGAWQAAGIFTQARKIVLENLVSGSVYEVQARAIGGSTGYSDWSDPMSHRVL